MQNCPSLEMLRDFSQGQSLPTWEAIATHVDTCLACQEHLDTIAAANAGWQRQASNGPPRYVDEPELRRVLANVEKAYSESRSDSDFTRTKPEQRTADRSDEDTWQGRSLGVYRLESLLARGGMGSVYRAVHTKLERPVALKILPPVANADRQLVDRFAREIKSLGRLDHAHLVRATDADEADGIHFLVMELIEGSDLARLVKRHGPMRVEDASELIRQAALGLQYIHEQGLVHRDIKPSNLMLADEGPLKILDLGLALLLEAGDRQELTSSGIIMGTADYIAPEQVDDSHRVDHRADLYSLGCTFYFLLTGTAPFARQGGTSRSKRILAHLHAPIPKLVERRPEVPAELSQLVEQLMAKQPDDRPQSAAEVADKLVPFTSGNELGSLRNASHHGPLRRLLGWFASAAVVVTLAAAAILLSIHRRDDGKEAAQLQAATREATTQETRFVVANTNDVGPGSLRWAIEQANDRSAPTTIVFNIPTSDPNFIDVDAHLSGGDPDPDVFVIQIRFQLALSGDNITIDGRSQAAFTGVTNPFGPEIVIDGSLGSSNGLVISSNNNRISGLNIQGSNHNGIFIVGNHNWIEGNYIGTDATGTRPAPNARSATWRAGVYIATGATGNLIGTNADGIADETQRNVISGNAGRGIFIQGASENTVAGNFIGTDATGSVALGNELNGVIIRDGGRGNVIGGSAPGAGNLISNNGNGVQITGSHDNLVIGNFIGTDLTGTVALGNIGEGVQVSGGAQGNRIGGSEPGERNVISGNTGNGVQIWGTDTEHNAVLGNYIGTDATGTARLANGGQDVLAAGTVNHVEANRFFGGPEDGATLSSSVNGDIRPDNGDIRRTSPSAALPDQSSFPIVRRFEGHEDGIEAVAFSPNGRFIASGGGLNTSQSRLRGSDFDVRLWDLASGRLLHQFAGHTDRIVSLVFSSDGEILVSGSYDRTVRVWNLGTREEVHRLNNHFARLDISADGRQLLAGGWSGVVLLDLMTGETRPLKGLLGGLFDVSISPDGGLAAATGRPEQGDDFVVRLWNTNTGLPVQDLVGHLGDVRGIAFLPDGQRLVSAGYADRTVRVWDVGSGQELNRLSEVGQSLGLAVDGQDNCLIAVGNNLRLWNLESGTLVREWQWPAHGIAISSDGRFALSGGSDKVVRLWQLP